MHRCEPDAWHYTLVYSMNWMRIENVIFCGCNELCSRYIWVCLRFVEQQSKYDKKSILFWIATPKQSWSCSLCLFFTLDFSPIVLSLSLSPILPLMPWCDCIIPWLLCYVLCTISTKQWHKQLYSEMKNRKLTEQNNSTECEKWPFLWKMHSIA